MHFSRHLFVCTAERPPFAKPSCAPRGSRALFQALVDAVDGAGLTAEVGVTATGCLGPCDSGATIVVYPEGVWYRGVTVDDVSELMASHIRDGRPVQRLLSPRPTD